METQYGRESNKGLKTIKDLLRIRRTRAIGEWLYEQRIVQIKIASLVSVKSVRSFNNIAVVEMSDGICK